LTERKSGIKITDGWLQKMGKGEVFLEVNQFLFRHR
jgi:hypothetical protein